MKAYIFPGQGSQFKGMGKELFKNKLGKKIFKESDEILGFKISEIPVQMRERSAGQPSNRNFRLVYYFLRLLIVLLAGTRGKKKE